jgi:signal transduction histidine kinase/DNA-binding NarL/FixJ family response regulator
VTDYNPKKYRSREKPLLFHQLRSSLLILILSLTVTGGVIYHYSEEVLLQTVQNSLKYHADFRMNRILAFYQSQKAWMESQSNNQKLKRAIVQLIEGIEQNRDKRSLAAVDGLYFDLSRRRYQKDEALIRKSFSFADTEELFILDAEGHLLFSFHEEEEHKELLGENLGESGFYGSTPLSRLIQRIRNSRQFEISEFGFSEIFHKPTLLMGIPLFSPTDGSLSAILVRNFSITQLRELLESYSGLGESGEVLVAHWRTSSQETGISFINRFRNIEQREPSNHCQELRQTEPHRFPMQEALNKKNGSGWKLENSCREAFTIWRWIPELRWGMVVKQDREEVMAPIQSLQQKIIIVTLSMLLFIFWMVYRQSKLLSSPLENLTQAVIHESISTHKPGKFTEVNRLAKVFRDYSQEILNRNFLMEQQSAEMAYAKQETDLILESMDEGLIVLNHQQQIIRVNQKFSFLCGEDEKHLLGKRAEELFEDEHTLRTYSGTSIPVRIARSRLSRNRDKGAAEVMIVNDLREILIAENAIQANKAKDQFLAMMSHELRTPLTAIIGYAELLAKSTTEVCDEQQQNMLHSIAVSGRTQLTLINDILDLSKIEAGKFEIGENNFNLYELIEEIEDIFSLRAREAGIRFEIQQPLVLKHQLVGDSVRIGQILMNLLSNAFKFTEQGHITLTITIEKASKLMHYRVEDSGIGMTPEVLSRLFRPFEQADSSITRRFGGTGLGLNISWNLASMMNGQIDVESEEGVGSRFELTLPYRPSELLAINKKTDSITQESHQLQGDILLVEDTMELQLLTSSLLQFYGVTVTVASNGDEGVKAALSNHFDLVLMDKHMPVMSGTEAIRSLRAQHYRQPIYAFTADVMEHQQQELIEAGFDGVLVKPINQVALIKLLKRYLKNVPVTTTLSDTATAQTDQNRTNTNTNNEDSHSGSDSSNHYPMVDPAILAQLRPLFIERMGELKGELLSALEQNDLKKLSITTHNIKGSAGSYGYPQITECATQINDLLKQDPTTPQVMSGTYKLIADIERAIIE